LIARHPAGDHDLFMGEILAVHHSPAAFSPAKTVDVNQVRPVVYLGDDRYSTLASGDVVYLDRKALVAARALSS
jgi:flavin reductase (DIM6/NTAB) family NADH-FMN oxidoreductase RutF